MSENLRSIPFDGIPKDPSFANVSEKAATTPVGTGARSSMPAAFKKGTNCFGGTLFHRSNTFGLPEICFAVKGLDDITLRQIRQRYATLRHRCSSLPLIPCTDIETDGEYVIFVFALSEKERSLRQILAVPENALRPMTLLKKLVVLIRDYHACMTAENRAYTPLCCLTADTVYLDQNHHLRVLPLPLCGSPLPKGLPAEAGTKQADVSSDLYSAAYLYAQLLSSDPNMPSRPDHATVQQMLYADPAWRPKLSEVTAALLTPTTAAPEQSSDHAEKFDFTALKHTAAQVFQTAKTAAGKLKTLAGRLQRPERGSDTLTIPKED